MEFFANKRVSGRDQWHHRFGIPEVGVSITYFDTKMDPTGSLFYGLVYMQFFPSKWKFGALALRFGTGLTYAPRRYDKESNNLNNMMSSALSYNMQGRIGMRFNLAKSWTIHPHVVMSHSSNGSIKLPNAGINIFSAGIELGYHFGDPEISESGSDMAPDRSAHLNFLISGTLKELYPTGGDKYGFFTLRSYLDKPLNSVSRLLGGVEVFSNRSLKEEIRRLEEIDNSTDHRRIGVFVGHELVVSRISVVVQAGRYVYRPFKEDSDADFYQRYGLKYYFLQKYFITTMLKSHGGRADNFDFGLGIRL